jgi:mono/diheme cytochrome c family protein
MSRRMTVFAVAAVLVFCTEVAAAADPAAGKAEVDKVCSACHESADWKGKSAGQIETQIKGVVAGKTKHPKKLDLSDAQIADVAAFWASAN